MHAKLKAASRHLNTALHYADKRTRTELGQNNSVCLSWSHLLDTNPYVREVSGQRLPEKTDFSKAVPAMKFPTPKEKGSGWSHTSSVFQPNLSFTYVSLTVCENGNEATGAYAFRIEDVYTTQDYQLVAWCGW